ncbi:hypothetical protein [Paenibacillus senegalensis]|uniref:hypothetical protein n=1 Tax=Paenibacillus senegalensis TaxID=1465766 RepID=UPI0002EEC354|nr:hypothetical protein [Paenibacillus senegalensis]
MSFDTGEEAEFFVPTSIGSDSADEQKVYDTLKNNRIIDGTAKKDQIHFIGFWSPQDAGVHKMRLYFENKNLLADKEMYLVYVHKEEGRFGKDLGWTQLTSIDSEL